MATITKPTTKTPAYTPRIDRVFSNQYEVESQTRQGFFHTVRIADQGQMHCSCQAGAWGKKCWHKAAVSLLLQAEANRIQPCKSCGQPCDGETALCEDCEEAQFWAELLPLRERIANAAMFRLDEMFPAWVETRWDAYQASIY